MADFEVNDNRSPSERLKEDVSGDLKSRADWHDRTKKHRRQRLGERESKPRYYRGYPNFLEPLIDDNVRQVTDAENSIIWSGTRYLASFMPLDSNSLKLKRKAEIAFDTMLRVTLDPRAKLESLLDMKNEGGMSVAKFVENSNVIPGQVLPDFDHVDPLDVIVPVGTRRMRDAERVCHALRYTIRELRDIGKQREWKNIEAIIDVAKRNAGASRDGIIRGGELAERGDIGSISTLMGLNAMPSSLEWIIIWECYHYGKDGNKRVTIFSPIEPNLVLADFLWTYPPNEVGKGISLLQSRPWPFVQFRYENRNGFYYDTRGIAILLEDNQKTATQLRNASGVQLDFFTFPFVKGNPGSLHNFRFRPGERVPNDFELVRPPPTDQKLEVMVDRERANASRRVGSPQGALSSQASVKTPKTATEITRSSLNAGLISSNAVMRFTEPLAEIFQMQWDYLKHFPVDLPAIIDNEVVFLSKQEILDSDFLVTPTISGRNANPDFILSQLFQLAPFLQNNPFVKRANFTKMLFDQIDPMISEELVLDPESAEQGQTTIEEQVNQIQEAIQILAKEVQSHKEFLNEQAEIDSEEPEAGEAGQPPLEIEQGEAI